MKALRASIVLLFVATLVATITPATARAPDSECDPYPIGRCGAYQREEVTFCFIIQNSQYISATDDAAVGVVGTQQAGVGIGLNQVDNPQLYLRTEPLLRFVGDPNTAPAPFSSIWQEKNGVFGLQITNFQCGLWVWFAECEPPQWMGPTGLSTFEKDLVIT